MNILEGKTTDPNIYKHSYLIVLAFEREWKDSSNRLHSIVLRFKELSGKYGDNAYWFIIVDESYQIVATATAGITTENTIHLYNLLVTPEYRKKGYCRKLFNRVLEYAKNLKMNLFLYTDSSLIDMYKSFGGIVVSQDEKRAKIFYNLL